MKTHGRSLSKAATLAAIKANPFSTQNIQDAAIAHGLSPHGLLKMQLDAVEAIPKDDPEHARAVNALSQTWLPYIAKKLSNESSDAANLAPQIVIQQFNIGQEQAKQSPAIDV